MRRTTVAASQKRKNPGQVKRTLRLTRKMCAQRITVEDENSVHNFAVEPTVSRSHPLPSALQVPVLQNSDLLHPQFQSTLPVLATLDSLKLGFQGSTLMDYKQVVGKMLSKSPKSCTLPSISLERRMFHELRPLEVNSEVIDKKSHMYLSTAVGNAPLAVAVTNEKDESLTYPFKISPSNLVAEFSSFNQFIGFFNIGLKDENTPENCCVNVAVRDLN